MFHLPIVSRALVDPAVHTARLREQVAAKVGTTRHDGEVETWCYDEVRMRDGVLRRHGSRVHAADWKVAER